MRLQVLLDLTNAQKLQRLDVSNSGVVLSAQLIEDMKAEWPSIDFVTQDTSSQMQCQENSHRMWPCSLGMIAALHCGCIGISLEGTHLN